jgi:hypothetical protein
MALPRRARSSVRSSVMSPRDPTGRSAVAPTRRRETRPAVAVGAACLAGLLVLAACNDDDDTATPATLRPSDSVATVAATTVTTATPASTDPGATTTATTAATTAASASSTTVPGTPTTLTGSGNVVEREYPLADFTDVDASSSFTVAITRADAFRVAVKADDNIFERLVVEVVDGTLRIGVAPETTLRNVHLEATVTMPELSSLEASGGVTATLTGFASTVDRSLELAGASTVTAAAPFAAEDLEVDAAGGSTVTLTGTATEATVQLSGGSELDAAALTVDTAEFELSGGAEATMTVTSSIESAELSGGSQLTYLGTPALGSIETSGGSQVSAG